MNDSELIDLAANKVGGISELARRLDWNKGNIARAKSGKAPVPPYRAAQMAEILGKDPKAAYVNALKEQAATEYERGLLGELLKAVKTGSAVLTVAFALFVGTLVTSEPSYASNISNKAENIHYSQS